MKWIKIPINLPDFAELLRQAQLFSVNEPNVTPVDEKKKKKYHIDRNKPRAWALLPSIKDFGIELRPFDWLLQLFKLKRKWKPQLSFTTWYNDGSNIYLDYMFKRLTNQVASKQYDRAQETMWQLMSSSVYQVSALNHVLRNWHRKLSYKQVKWILRDVKKLVAKKAIAIKYARVYLQEKNKIRPLGVPSMSWRIYLHMYNNCLVEWRMLSESGKQHGYLPQKGVITAWFEIVKRLNRPNIYEADFKNFFGSVSHEGLASVLEEIGLPKGEINFIISLNKSLPKLTEKDQIPEPDRAIIKNTNNKYNTQPLDEVAADKILSQIDSVTLSNYIASVGKDKGGTTPEQQMAMAQFLVAFEEYTDLYNKAQDNPKPQVAPAQTADNPGGHLTKEEEASLILLKDDVTKKIHWHIINRKELPKEVKELSEILSDFTPDIEFNRVTEAKFGPSCDFEKRWSKSNKSPSDLKWENELDLHLNKRMDNQAIWKDLVRSFLIATTEHTIAKKKKGYLTEAEELELKNLKSKLDHEIELDLRNGIEPKKDRLHLQQSLEDFTFQVEFDKELERDFSGPISEEEERRYKAAEEGWKGWAKENEWDIPKKTLIDGRWENIERYKSHGVPQGAPTSCSLATLALRPLEKRLDVIIYADDVIYFPERSDVDPYKELTDLKYGIELNVDKSRWIKKDGLWLVDSFKFLGIVYFTPRLRKEASNWIVQRFVSLSNMLKLKIPTDLGLHGGKFRAATRKGADLEFTSRESFISYLATAREILLDSPYLLSVWKSKTLKEWLETREIQWRDIFKNKAKLLFSETFREIAKDPDGKLESEERAITLSQNPPVHDYELWISAKTNMETLLSSPELWMGKKGLYESWHKIYEKIVKEKTFVVKRYRNPLAGYFVAKMFNNHWTQNVKQKFGLSYIQGSWVAERWPSYSWEWILPKHGLTIFIASSFACHDLIRYASGLSEIKAGKQLIRRVSSQKSEKSDKIRISRELVQWKGEYLRKIFKSRTKSKFHPV